MLSSRFRDELFYFFYKFFIHQNHHRHPIIHSQTINRSKLPLVMKSLILHSSSESFTHFYYFDREEMFNFDQLLFVVDSIPK